MTVSVGTVVLLVLLLAGICLVPVAVCVAQRHRKRRKVRLMAGNKDGQQMRPINALQYVEDSCGTVEPPIKGHSEREDTCTSLQKDTV